jgi:pseudaminic acid cytidylyltransferase
MKIAIIPARGGSKRIPRKNIKEFSGQPMIAYAIRAALESQLFDRVVVSTDDAEIAEIAKQFGAEVPFIRPAELANDHTPTVPVIAHAIRELTAQGASPDLVCCIYPGVPLIRSDDLTAAYQLLLSTQAGYCYPVAEYPSAIQRSLRRLPDGCVRPLHHENEWTRTQDLETFYFDAGQFYWGQVSAWLSGLGLQSHGSGLVIPQWRVVDIDTPEDWHRAELMLRALQAASA